MGHEDKVLDMDVSPDGRYLVSGGMDDTLILWDVKTLSFKKNLEIHPDDIYSVEFSLDGKRVVTGCRDGVVRIVSVPEGEELFEMMGHSEEVFNAAFSPDGKYVASGGNDGTVRLWSAEDGELLKVFRGHGKKVSDVLFTKDSRYVISLGSDATIRTWSVEELKASMIDKINQYQVVTARLHPTEENVLAFTGESKRFDRTTRQSRRIFPLYVGELKEDEVDNIKGRTGHYKIVYGLEFSPDGSYLVSAGSDDIMYFWELDEPFPQQKVKPGVGSMWDVEISPDGNKLFVASSKKDILVFIKGE